MQRRTKRALFMLEMACGGAVLVITAVILLQVVSRYVLEYPLAWPEPVAGVIFVYLIFLGAVVAYRSDGLVRLTFLTDALPPVWRTAVALVINAIALAVVVVLVIEGIEATRLGMRRTMPVLDLPWSYVYAAFPIGLGLLGLAYSRAILTNARDLLIALRSGRQ